MHFIFPKSEAWERISSFLSGCSDGKCSEIKVGQVIVLPDRVIYRARGDMSHTYSSYSLGEWRDYVKSMRPEARPVLHGFDEITDGPAQPHESNISIAMKCLLREMHTKSGNITRVITRDRWNEIANENSTLWTENIDGTGDVFLKIECGEGYVVPADTLADVTPEEFAQPGKVRVIDEELEIEPEKVEDAIERITGAKSVPRGPVPKNPANPRLILQSTDNLKSADELEQWEERARWAINEGISVEANGLLIWEDRGMVHIESTTD